MPSEARHVGIVAAVDAEQRPNEQANTDGPLVVPKGVSTRREGVERASVQLPLLVLHGKLRGMESGCLVAHLLRSRLAACSITGTPERVHQGAIRPISQTVLLPEYP